MSRLRVVYYDPAAPDELQSGFPSGEAGFVALGPDETLEVLPRVSIGPNSHCALRGHGVVAALNRLPRVEGPIAIDVDAVIHPASLSDASRLLYEADRKTYGASYEFVASRAEGADPVEHRVVIDNREYQRTLSRLQYLVTLAGRQGQAVWIRL